jgi:Na+-transporting NADH:ubiquinone oxidoreductase subunit NqrD
VLGSLEEKLEISATITMIIFMVCELSNFIVYLLKVITPSTVESYIQLPMVISQFGLFAVLFYYTFQMKIVLIKITVHS